MVSNDGAADPESILMETNHLHFEDRASWRAWLKEHCESKREVWLMFFKKHTGKATISYDAAVEEALCFGWIDSLVRRLDEDRFVRRFTPRTDTCKWSELNLKRVEKMKAAGLMTAVGLAKIDPAVPSKVAPPSRSWEMPPYFQEALSKNEAANTFFRQLAPSYQRNFVMWVDSAKRDETRRRRLSEAITLLQNNRKLGMK